MTLMSADGKQTDVQEGCSFVWLVPQLNEVAIESRRAQTAAQHVTTLFAKAATHVFQAANAKALEVWSVEADRRAAEQRALNGTKEPGSA